MIPCIELVSKPGGCTDECPGIAEYSRKIGTPKLLEPEDGYEE